MTQRICSHCKQPVVLVPLDDPAYPNQAEWVTKYGNDPQCDDSPDNTHDGAGQEN